MLFLLLLLLLPLLWEGSLCQRLEVQPSVTVQKGLCVHIPCAINHSEVPLNGHNRVYGYWFRAGTEVSRGSPVATNDPRWRAWGRFHLIGDPRMKDCSLSITNAKMEDTGSYFFHIDYEYDKYSYLKEPLYVNVTDLIQKPNISVPEVLESGSPVTLKCTFPWACENNRPVTFSWMGAALSSQSQSSGLSYSSEVSFTPGPQHHGTSLTCKVTLRGVHLSSERTIQLNVSYAVQNVTITVAQDNRTTDLIPGNSSVLVVQEGQSLQLLCAATSYPPAALSWILGNQTLMDGVLPLDLPNLGPADEGNYTCLAQHPLGSKQASLRVSVQYSPRVISSSCSWVEVGLSCTCSVQAEPAPSLHWLVGGKLVEGNGSSDTLQVILKMSGPWANSSLSMKVGRIPDSTIGCEGKNPQGTHTLLFQLLPDGPTPSHVFSKAVILGVLCGVGATSLLALCLLLLVKMRRKKSAAAAASRGRMEDPKGPSGGPLSLSPTSSATDKPPNPAAPEDAPDELHYACLNFQGAKAREDHGSTDPLTEYSEIKFQ